MEKQAQIRKSGVLYVLAPALSLQLRHSASVSNNNKRFFSENISHHKLVRQCELEFLARKFDSTGNSQGTPELRVWGSLQRFSQPCVRHQRSVSRELHGLLRWHSG